MKTWSNFFDQFHAMESVPEQVCFCKATSKSEFSLGINSLKTKCLKSKIKGLYSGDHYLIKVQLCTVKNKMTYTTQLSVKWSQGQKTSLLGNTKWLNGSRSVAWVFHFAYFKVIAQLLVLSRIKRLDIQGVSYSYNKHVFWFPVALSYSCVPAVICLHVCLGLSRPQHAFHFTYLL